MTHLKGNMYSILHLKQIFWYFVVFSRDSWNTVVSHKSNKNMLWQSTTIEYMYIDFVWFSKFQTFFDTNISKDKGHN